ncbi:hypothetical protein [Amycolatopsis keratiniphila]|uniref:hypothetical protein n=1 Tax=Amycolatopsis keratiniphila TaxID=129921 RepID=UPI0007B1E39F|nr:hypothetical protein [Amycolatopsis keratiniphila]
MREPWSVARLPDQWFRQALSAKWFWMRFTKGTTPVPWQPPSATNDFVGRVEQLAVLDIVLREARTTASVGTVMIPTLDGTTGVSKTTLAAWRARQVQEYWGCPGFG